MVAGNSNSISPTAHYTGFVWARNGLSHPSLGTAQGRLFYNALRPMNAACVAAGGPSLEHILLARHRAIDTLLERAIDNGEVTQIIEIAAGLSPRGWRFTQRYGKQITYIETDLPSMAKRKRRLLAKMGAKPGQHRVAELNALADIGPTSLGVLAEELDPAQGLAVISEGLLNYFDQANVVALWERIARCLQPFNKGLYLADLFVAKDNAGVLGTGFRNLLSAFVRGRVHFHFDDAQAAAHALAQAGLDAARLQRPSDFLPETTPAMVTSAKRVRIIEAKLG